MYPENEIYCVMPIDVASSIIGDYLEYCLKSVDGNFCVWSFNKFEPILDVLREYPNVCLFNHIEILDVLACDKWRLPDDNLE